MRRRQHLETEPDEPARKWSNSKEPRKRNPREMIGRTVIAVLTLRYVLPYCYDFSFSFRKAQFKVAVEHYTRSVAKDPENAKTLSNRAACYHKLEQMELCIQVKIRESWCIISFSGLQLKYCFGPPLCQAQTEEGFCSAITRKVARKLEWLHGCPWTRTILQRGKPRIGILCFFCWRLRFCSNTVVIGLFSNGA